MPTYLEVLISIIIKQYFNNIICIMHYHDNPDNLIQIHTVPSISRRIEGIQNLELDVHQKCRLFLLQCDDARRAFEATEIVIRIDSERLYNNRKYIIIINSEDAFAELFDSINLSFVRDLLVIYIANHTAGGMVETFQEIARRPKHDSNKSINISIHFDLFTHKYIGMEGNNDPILLDIWFAKNSSFKFGNSLFPDKITNQEGRELKAPCMDLEPYALCDSDPPRGNEFNAVIEFSKRFNFTLNSYLKDSYGPYGDIFENWTGYGVVGRLVQEDEDYCDIVYGGFPDKFNVDLIRSVRYSYVVSVPLPTVKYGYFMFTEVLTIQIWLAILLMQILIRSVVFIRRKYVIVSNLREAHINNLTLYGILINQSFSVTNDIQNSVLLKYLMVIMLTSNVWFGTAYNSRLASVMVKPVLENDINTLAELAHSDLDLLFFDEYYDTMANDERNIYKKLYNKIVLIPNNTDFELSKKYLSSGKYAVARYRRINGEYFEEPGHLQQMRGKYKPITPELFTDFYYIMLRKNSMHTEMFQNMAATLEETGLMIFWEEVALRDKQQTTFQKQMQEYSLDIYNSNLNLMHLKGLFAFWGCGLGVSLLVLLKELITNSFFTPLYEYSN